VTEHITAVRIHYGPVKVNGAGVAVTFSLDIQSEFGNK